MSKAAVPSLRVPRRTKKPRGKGPVRLNYNLPGDLVSRLDRYREKLEAEDRLGRPVTRTDAIKALLTRALDGEGVE